jgi:hypothetical protein
MRTKKEILEEVNGTIKTMTQLRDIGNHKNGTGLIRLKVSDQSIPKRQG